MAPGLETYIVPTVDPHLSEAQALVDQGKTATGPYLQRACCLPEGITSWKVSNALLLGASVPQASRRSAAATCILLPTITSTARRCRQDAMGQGVAPGGSRSAPSQLPARTVHFNGCAFHSQTWGNGVLKRFPRREFRGCLGEAPQTMAGIVIIKTTMHHHHHGGGAYHDDIGCGILQL